MLAFIARYGLIAGLAVGVPLSAFVLLSEGRVPSGWGMAVGYLTMLAALSAVFVGVKRYRDEALGGAIGFRPALLLGLGISAVASVVYVAAWETATALSGLDFAAVYSEMLVREQRAAGATPAAIARLEADMAVFRAQYANPLYRLPITFTEIFPVGVLVSLVTALLLRNRGFLPARAV